MICECAFHYSCGKKRHQSEESEEKINSHSFSGEVITSGSVNVVVSELRESVKREHGDVKLNLTVSKRETGLCKSLCNREEIRQVCHTGAGSCKVILVHF